MALVNAFGSLSLEATQSAVKTAVEAINTKTPGLSGGSVPVTFTWSGLTDAQLRDAPVPVSGVFWPATQPVSASALPLPTGAASESTLAAILAAYREEDSAHGSGDLGLPLLGVRWDSDTPTSGANGDYTALKLDEAGRLKTASQPAKYDLVTGAITANGQTVFLNCSRGSNVVAHVVATSLVGHNAAFEASIDSTNGTDGAWVTVDACRSGAVNTPEATTGVLAATPAYGWEISVNGYNWLRVRATAHTSGTATWKFQQAPYATEPAPRSYATATQSISGTVTAAVTPPAPATPYFVNSAATTNGALILAGTSGIQFLYATNEGASPAYIKLYNKATAPTVGTDIPEMIIPIPAAVGGFPGVANPNTGSFIAARFALGLGIAITRNAVHTDTTAVGAGEVKVKLSRTA